MAGPPLREPGWMRGARLTRGPRTRHRLESLRGPLTPPTSRDARVLLALLLAALIGASSIGRVLPGLDTVYATRDAQFLGADPYYHLRHTRWTVDHFPRIHRFDDQAYYPQGTRADSTGLFNVAMATAALVVGGGDPSERTLRDVMVFTPVVLWALTLVLLFLIARDQASARWGVAAVALCTLLPGPLLPRSVLGATDNHSAEVVLGLWLFASVARALRDDAGRRHALLAALPLWALVYTWRGAPLFLIALVASLGAAWLAAFAGGQDSRRIARVGAGAGLISIAVFLPLAALVPSLVLVPSAVGPIVALMAALALAPAALELTGTAAARRGWPRPWVALALLGACLVAVAVIAQQVPALARLLVEPRATTVAEHVAVDGRYLWSQLGLVPLLCLPAAGFLLLRAAKTEDSAGATLGVGATLLVAEWVLTYDFGYLASPFAVAALVLAAHRLIGDRPAFVVGLTAALALPLLLGVQAPLYTARDFARANLHHSGWHEAMRWMAAETPDDSYGVASSWPFGHFIAAEGHRPVRFTQEPTRDAAAWLVARDEAKALEALCRPCDGDQPVRYVVVDAQTAAESFLNLVTLAGEDPSRYQGSGGEATLGGAPVALTTYGLRYEQSLAAWLLLRDGRGLRHFRQVYTSPTEALLMYVKSEQGGTSRTARRTFLLDGPERDLAQILARSPGLFPLPDGVAYGGVRTRAVKIFEVVEGARIRGQASPGHMVEAVLKGTMTTTKAPWETRVRTRANRDGAFTLHLPHATDGLAPSALATEPTYALSTGAPGAPMEERQRFAVSEADVTEGRVVVLP